MIELNGVQGTPLAIVDGERATALRVAIPHLVADAT
jgi:hypothetical protein